MRIITWAPSNVVDKEPNGLSSAWTIAVTTWSALSSIIKGSNCWTEMHQIPKLQTDCNNKFKRRKWESYHILKNQTHIVNIKIESFKHLTKKNGWPDLPSSEYSWLAAPTYPIQHGPSALKDKRIYYSLCSLKQKCSAYSSSWLWYWMAKWWCYLEEKRTDNILKQKKLS